MSAVDELNRLFPFELDDFQQEAIRALDKGQNVVVCAPTGAGKTVIAEFAALQAIERGCKLFYTTPLKALSNQKYYDFCRQYGEDNVGLLTGDISINRDARLLIMTTEVFRNMLYGTHSDPTLLDSLGYVVLDECHFMNDADRGTVWEESIIYCPQHVKTLALSATVANAKELTAWMNAVHPETVLIESDWRPVPLRFFYYRAHRNDVLPLFDSPTKPGLVNKRLRESQQQIKDLKKKKSAYSPAALVRQLSEKDMLPAIVFTFSRRGCDDAVREATRQFKNETALVNKGEVAAIDDMIDAFLVNHPMFDGHPLLASLRLGLASHHAGLMPGLKWLVEQLFQQNLIKVVFATETLAAGINMPARTTVISSISKRGDRGHRLLTASEFLQMSGRAGRRGMDEVGNVVVVSSPFHASQEAATLASSPPDPLTSQFTPTYGMVINLLQRHSLDETHWLIEKSFGQFTSESRLEPLKTELEGKQGELDRIVNFDCPYGLSNAQFIAYCDTKAKYNTLIRQRKPMQRQLAKGDDPELREAVEAMREEEKTLKAALQQVECFSCDIYSDHRKALERSEKLTKKVKRLEADYEGQREWYWHQFMNLYQYLKSMGCFMDADGSEQGSKAFRVSAAGSFAGQIRTENEWFFTEIVMPAEGESLLMGLAPPQLAGVLSALTIDSVRENTYSHVRASRESWDAVQLLYKLQKRLDRQQEKYGITLPLHVQPIAAGLVEAWTTGLPWEKLIDNSSFDEGDLVRILRRTADLLRQLSRIPEVPPALGYAARQALKTLYRDPIREADPVTTPEVVDDETPARPHEPEAEDASVTLAPEGH